MNATTALIAVCCTFESDYFWLRVHAVALVENKIEAECVQTYTTLHLKIETIECKKHKNLYMQMNWLIFSHRLRNEHGTVKQENGIANVGVSQEIVQLATIMTK